MNTKAGKQPAKKRKGTALAKTRKREFAVPALQSSATGIWEFDQLLGGGFPRGATVLLAGPSGSGKTILSFQWLFEGVKNGENGVYVALTEPLFKAIKDLEAMGFYDRQAVEQEKLKVVDLRDGWYEKACRDGQGCVDLDKLIAIISREVKQNNAKRLCIDSVTAIAYEMNDKYEVRSFIFELGTTLAALGCTTVLISEVLERGKYSIFGVEEFISDTIIRMDLEKERGTNQRVIQIVKVRGRQHSMEESFLKISKTGITVFPKQPISLSYPATTERVSTGIPALDEMFFGGLFKGSSTLVSAATGTGKTVLCLHFLVDGLQNNEPCLYAGFEESRDQIIRDAKGFGWDLEKYEKTGLLVLRCAYPDEKLIEEHLADITHLVESRKIKRCAVDSLSSIAIGIPADEFSAFSRRLNSKLKSHSVTSVLTATTPTLTGLTAPLSEAQISTSTDNIISLRYAEIEGTLGTVLNVVKQRGSGHSKDLKRYDVTSAGFTMGESLAGYEGVTTGATKKVSETLEEQLENEFKAFIGPMGASVFSEIKAKGLSKARITTYIDDLARQGILKKEDAEAFKQKIAKLVA